MTFENIGKTNRALVFGVFKPGEESLADKLDEWDGDSGPVFIETKLRKECRYKQSELRKAEIKFYATFQESKGGATYDLSPSGYKSQEIVLNDHHPLYKLVFNYQKQADTVGAIMVDAATLDPFKGGYLCSKTRELFNKTLNAFQKKDNKLFNRHRKVFLNFLHDPLCLYGALLDVFEAGTDTTTDNKFAELPASEEKVYIPIPIPERLSDYAQTNQSSDLNQALPEKTQNTDPNLPQAQEDKIQHCPSLPALVSKIKQDSRWNEKGYLPKIYKEYFKNTLNPDDPASMDWETFLLFCLSDSPLVTYIDKISMIINDKKQDEFVSQNGSSSQDEVSEIRVCFKKLLQLQLKTVGSLLANIEGLKVITSACANIPSQDAPEIYLANCSLSKIYENDELKHKFLSVLKNINPDPGIDSNSNLGSRIGFCLFPKLSVHGKAQDQNEAEDDFFGDDLISEPETKDLGDSTDITHFCDFLKFCSDNKLRIMNLVSPAHDLPVHKINTDKFFDSEEKDSPAYILNYLQNKTGTNSNALKYLSLCVPDKIFINSLELSIGLRTPMVLIKGAFLAAAVLMRNDSPQELRRLVAEHGRPGWVKSGQAGVAVGPGALWKGKKMFDVLRSVFELEGSSDIGTDVRVLEQILDSEAGDPRFSFLRHEKGMNIALQLANTAFKNEDGKIYPLNLVRARDLIYLEKGKNSLKTKDIERNMNTPNRWNKNSDNEYYINALQGENVEFDISDASAGANENIMIK